MLAARSRLVDQLYERLPEAMGRALTCAVAAAARQGVELYVVGGGVRDLLLGSPHVDVDIVLEGDASKLAHAAGRALRARVVVHERFGTAVISGDGFRLDLAQARRETYERPGALPAVRPARLADDLTRRDFTINAIALRLTGRRAGALADPHGGALDLERRQVRVLHDGSFRDDATRILRALRYAGRLGFRLERRTASLLKRDLSYLATISGARLRRELELIAVEERIVAIVRLAQELGALAALHTALRAGERELAAIERLPELAVTHRDAALFCLLLADASVDEAEGVIERLSLTRRQADAVGGFLALRGRTGELAQAALRPSEAAGIFGAHSPVAIEAFALVEGSSLAGERARRYLDVWRHLRPRLNGRDVEALGVPHGPRVGAALAALRTARLDGHVTTREDEVALIRKMHGRTVRVAGARDG